jgi:IS4 transposase
MERILILVLLGKKRSIQNNLNMFFDRIGEVDLIPSSSSYTQARSKLKPEAFNEISNKVVTDFYRLYDYDKWNNKRLVGIDGSLLNLPLTKETKAKYIVKRNKKVELAQCLASFAYDVLNEITISAKFDVLQGEKEFIINEHIKKINKDDILLMDRAYADYSLMAMLIKEEIDFVVRIKTKSTNKEIYSFLESGKSDDIVLMKCTKGQNKFVKENELPKEIKVRLVKIVLDTGEIEVLVTTLFYETIEEINYLYGKRWGIETYFDRLKSIFELERFSGKSLNSIEQDFFSVIFLTNFESILVREANDEIKEDLKHRNYEYKVNRNVSYSTLTNNIIELFLLENVTISYILDKINIMLKKNPIIIRNERKYQRKPTTSSSLRYNLYTKRISC